MSIINMSVFFSFFFSVFSSNPFSFPPHAHTHPHRAVTRTASLETLLGPCFVPQPVIPTPYRKTNLYTGLWAQTKLRFKFHSFRVRQTRFQPPFSPCSFPLSFPPFLLYTLLEENLNTQPHSHVHHFFHIFSIFLFLSPCLLPLSQISDQYRRVGQLRN